MVFTAKKIELPSFGEKLKEAREAAELTKEGVAQFFNIQAKFLERLENNELEKLPADVYLKGFLRKYAEVLKIKPVDLLADYEKEAKISRHLAKKAPFQAASQFRFSRLAVTPKVFSWFLGSLILILVIGYLLYQLNALISPPSLSIFEPAADLFTKQTNLVIRGQTAPEARLTINGQLLNIDKDGYFEQAVNLNSGLNTFKIEAANRFGKSRAAVRQVIVK